MRSKAQAYIEGKRSSSKARFCKNMPLQKNTRARPQKLPRFVDSDFYDNTSVNRRTARKTDFAQQSAGYRMDSTSPVSSKNSLIIRKNYSIRSRKELGEKKSSYVIDSDATLTKALHKSSSPPAVTTK